MNDMNIKTIYINNVRGIGEKKIELDMIPNKPSLLIAPNGSGKSSFALAFQWLGRGKMKLNPDDAYNGNIANKPTLKIVTDEVEQNEYIADENHNDVSKRFGICVINNGLVASTPGIHNGILASKAHIIVPEIVLLSGKVSDCRLSDDFEEVYSLEDMPNGLFPSISTLLNNNRFMALLDFGKIKISRRPLSRLIDMLNDIKTYTGTIVDRHKEINTKYKDYLDSLSQIQYVVGIMKRIGSTDAEVKLILKALRVITLAYRNSDAFKKRIKYAQFKLSEDSQKKLFQTLKTTWKGIRPHKEGDKLILKIGDAQRISNGERDILLLLGHLQEAITKLNKTDNILIIDEVFDYLDDANLVAAQHYINLFIRDLKNEGKNIYPIILSHINPSYYRTFAFNNMKVYYLNPLQYPYASDNMMKLVRRRDELEKNDKNSADLISRYMFHYHADYSRQMNDIINMNEQNWGNIPTFKKYCLLQVDNYINGIRYDALGVCIALREMIEKYCYLKLSNEEQKRLFLEENGTGKKIELVENLGVVVPETFSILGLIYNDSLHFNNKNKIDLRQTLYSRLENNTIKGIVGEIKKLYDSLEQ